MERSDCCVVTPSRGTAPGVAGRLLTAAWRDLAEAGGPACVLRVRGGVLGLAWVNRALCELLATDAGELAGRPLRDLVVERPTDGWGAGPTLPGPRAPDPVAGAAPRAAAPWGVAPADGVPPEGMPPSGSVGEDADLPPIGPAEPLPIDWATVAHRLARGSGGSAVALLEREDGTAVRVSVRVLPVADPHPDATVPGEPSGSGVPSGSGTGPGAGAPIGTGAPAGTGHAVDPDTATVHDPGVVDALAPSAPAACWLVTLDPVGETLAELEGALTTAEHRFAALARCAPIGIFVSDVGLRLGFVNDRFVALTGLEGHALLGTGWLDAVHRDDLPAVYAAVQTVLQGTPVELAIRLVRDEARQCWLQLRLAPTTTPTRAAGFIGTAEDVTQRRSWEEHLTYQARHDPLTGLVNRRRLIEELADLLSSRRGRDREFAVLFLDLDGFKEINDTYGHEAGDRTLIEVARRMQRIVRESDVLARVAGDEFVVVLRQVTSEAEATAAARRHLAALVPPVRIGPAEVALTASVGIAMPSAFDSPESLLRAADRVMYEAKAAGHGLYRLAPVAGEGR